MPESKQQHLMSAVLPSMSWQGDVGPACHCMHQAGILQHSSYMTCRYAEFKVVGNASVHLTGYYMPEHDHGVQLSQAA